MVGIKCERLIFFTYIYYTLITHLLLTYYTYYYTLYIIHFLNRLRFYNTVSNFKQPDVFPRCS